MTFDVIAWILGIIAILILAVAKHRHLNRKIKYRDRLLQEFDSKEDGEEE